MMKGIRRIIVCCLMVTGSAHGAGVPATLEWGRDADLGFAVSGVIAEVLVSAGKSVSAGDALIRLDQREFNSAVARATAALARAQVELAEAEREDARAAELYERTVFSDHERELARIALRSARSERDIAAIELSGARLALERSVLRAPFSGLVLAIDAEVGEVVVSRIESKDLLRLADTRIMYARAQLGADDLAAIETGGEAVVKLRSGPVPGRIEQVGREPSGGDERYAVVVGFEVPDGIVLRAGERVDLEL